MHDYAARGRRVALGFPPGHLRVCALGNGVQPYGQQGFARFQAVQPQPMFKLALWRRAPAKSARSNSFEPTNPIVAAGLIVRLMIGALQGVVVIVIADY